MDAPTTDWKARKLTQDEVDRLVKNAKWEFRKLKQDEVKLLFEWRTYVARREKTMDYFLWEYTKGPWGPVETSILEQEGNVIAQVSSQRQGAFFFGEKIMFSMYFDIGVHPDFRKQGIWLTLGIWHHQEEGKLNIHFSAGFPNKRSYASATKFARILYEVPLFENSKINEIHVEKSNRFEFREIDRFDNEFTGFSERFSDDIPIYFNRSKEYLNWRFVDKPNLPNYQYEYDKYKIYDKQGDLISYIVTKLYEDEETKILHLVDFLTPNDEELYKEILAFLIQKAKTLDINTISLYIPEVWQFNKFLRKRNFMFKSTGRYYMLYTNNDVLDKDLVFDEKNHYLTMADHDVF